MIHKKQYLGHILDGLVIALIGRYEVDHYCF